MPYVFYILIVWMSVFPFLVQWGLIEFSDVWLGKRMSSVFQYPNTFATVVVMGWVYGLIQLTKKHIPWYQVIFYSLPLVMFTTDFLLSYSRGIIVLFPIAWFIGLIVLKPLNQLKYIVLSGVSVVGGLYIFRSFSDNIEDPYVGLQELVVLSVIMAILACLFTLLNKRDFKLNHNRVARWGIPTLVLAFCVGLVIDLWKKGSLYTLLPEALQGRIDSISLTTSSVVARFEFYEQSIEMSKDAPIFGFGGDGWRVLFTKYQEVPFWARETHNYYLELVLNIGWVGTIIVAAASLYLFVKAGQNMIHTSQEDQKTGLLATVPAIAMLLLHVVIDFDFSYGTVVLVLLFLLVMALPKKDLIKLRYKYIEKAIPIILIAGVSIATFITYQFNSAQEMVAEASEQNMTHEEAEQLYLTAKKKNAWNTKYYLELAKIYLSVYSQNKQESIQKRAYELLSEAKHLEPHNPSVNYEIGKVYSSVGDHKKAIEQFELAMEYDRFSRSYAFAYIVQNVLYGEELLRTDQKERALLHLSQATKRYEQQLEYIQNLKGKYIPDKRNLNLDKRAHLFAGEAYFLIGNKEQALKILTKKKYNQQKHQQEYIRSQAMKYIIAEEKGQSKKKDKIVNQVKQKQLLEEQIKFLSYLSEKD